MEDKRLDILERLPIPKGVMKMALPSIIGMLVMAIYNLVDTMFVAWIGTEATGATQIVFPITLILGAIGLTLGIGGGSYVSRLLGQKDYKRAGEVVSTNFFTAVGLGIVATILGIIFLEPILEAMGATNSIMEFAKDYGFYIMLGATAQISNMTLNNLLRSEGSSKSSMIGMATGAILNIFLDPIFIFLLGMGVKGAAIATIISQYVTMIILLGQYFSHKSILPISIKNVNYDKDLVLEVINIGAPSFARQVLMSISMGLMNHAAGTYGGDPAIAAIGIVLRTMMMVFYVIFGLSQGFQPVAGYNYGAKRYDRLMEALRFTLKLSMGIALFSSVLFYIFGDLIFSIFRPSTEVLSIALSFKNYFLLSLIIMSFTNVIGVYYQAIGKGMPALMLSLSRQGIFFIPIVLLLPKLYGLQGLYMAQPAADVLTLLLTVALFAPTRRELLKSVSSHL